MSKEIHVVRDADGHPFNGTSDGVEYIYGVAVEQKLVDALIYLKDCFESLHNLSRPRNAMDTTDEWLTIFCDLEKQMRLVRTLLGDQSHLMPTFDLHGQWVNAMAAASVAVGRTNKLYLEIQQKEGVEVSDDQYIR